MKILFFHNSHDKTSNALLAEYLSIFPNLEVVDFMSARQEHWFRGCPSIMIEGLWQKDVDVTLADFQEALSKCKELVIEGSTTVQANIPAIYNVKALDPYGNEALLPADLAIEIGYSTPVVINESPFELTFTDPGIYKIAATGTDSMKAEVVVTAQT